MTRVEELSRNFRKESSHANRGLAINSYDIGAISGVTLGLGFGGEAYSLLAENLITGIPSTVAIAIGAVGLLHSRKDIKREIDWALEDQAKSVQIPDSLTQVTE